MEWIDRKIWTIDKIQQTKDSLEQDKKLLMDMIESFNETKVDQAEQTRVQLGQVPIEFCFDMCDADMREFIIKSFNCRT